MRSGNKDRRVGDWPFLVALLIICVAFVPGCSNPAPFELDKGILLLVLSNLKQLRKLQFKRGEILLPGQSQKIDHELTIDRHKAWFIFRRAERIGARHLGGNVNDLINAVRDQFDRIETYVNAKIGTGGPLSGLVDTSTPGGAPPFTPQQPFASSLSHHFDLNNIARPLVSRPSPGLAEEYRKKRLMAVRVIAWHAAGLHDALWSQNGDGATLDEPALNEIVDRRLRAIERMMFQINPGGLGRTAPGGPGRGPWFDDSRTRVFEYPYFARSLINPADVAIVGAAPDPNKIWVPFGPALVQYNWPAPRGFEGALRSLEPASLSPDWPPISISATEFDNYSRKTGTGSIAVALDDLFKSARNIWERAWLFCDISIAATHLEALRFALARRGPSSGDFDSLVRPKFPFIGGILGGDVTYSGDVPSTVDDQSLWNDGVASGPGDTGGLFDNTFVKYRDLQVGDHVILWNHHLYSFVTRGLWKLENAFVTDMDVVTDKWDEKKGANIDPSVFMAPRKETLALEGFGAAHPYNEFRQKLFEDFIGGFQGLYDQIPIAGNAFVATNTAAKSIVVRWAPYTTGIAGSSWFVFLKREPKGSRGGPYPSVAKMLEIIRFSVANGPDRGTGYVPPPLSVTIGVDTYDLTDGVFFPLFLPKVGGVETDWQGYFERRRADASAQATLGRIRLLPEMVPGLFVRGKEQPIEVIRPRVRPTGGP